MPQTGSGWSAPAKRPGRTFLAGLRLLGAGLALTLIPSAAVPSAALAASRPVVVELFTSQGCSSCPPADALLTQLARRGDVLPLAFHVTYWNLLGWRDPYSFEGATKRQANYAAHLGGGSYTPEMVVDGRRGMVGSERGEVEAAIGSARGGAAGSVPVHLDHASGGTLAINIGAGRGEGQVILVGFDQRHQTPIGRGENGGRTLTESNIVRSFRVVGRYSGAPVQITERGGAGQEAAVIVQGADGRILGAARL